MIADTAAERAALLDISREAMRHRKRPWWDGRCVVLRPDVPNLDISSLQLIRSDAERAEVYARIDRAVAEAPEWPAWLWAADAP